MKTYVTAMLLFVLMLFLNLNAVFAQKHTRWTDTLDYNAARGKKSVLCGDETFYTQADQVPFYKLDGKKVAFLELLQMKLEEEPTIDGEASLTAEIVVNCKGVAGSLKLLKYGDKENPTELAMVKSINNAIAKLPDLMPAKNEGRVVNYKADKLKFKLVAGKITVKQ